LTYPSLILPKKGDNMVKDSVIFILVGFFVMTLICLILILICLYNLALYIVGFIVLILIAWFVGYIVLAPFIKEDE